MATIEPYETKAGKRYRVRYRTPGRGQTDKRGFKTKREAEAFAATVEVSKMRGEYVAPSHARMTVGELGPPARAHEAIGLPDDGDRVAGAGGSPLGRRGAR